jgi:hypothetical protein
MSTRGYRIPIDTAHKVLATFGITQPTRKYERWVKEDGFDLNDFNEVLFESPFVFIIDWRAWLQEELEAIAKTLALLNVRLEFELNEDGEAGYVRCRGSDRFPVSYRPNDSSDFDDVIRAVQAVVPENIGFRAGRENHGGDTWVYAVLPSNEWADLENLDRQVVDYFFVPLRPLASPA